MNEHDFVKWASSRHLQESIVASLKKAAAHAGDDTPVGRVVLDYAEIAEFTDDEVVDCCPFDAGFVVFGDCPNGDSVAVDVRNDSGSIHYLSHEESDGHSFLSIKVANTMQEFLTALAADEMPTDFHEAQGWDFSRDHAG
jgi:hypothetical protein